MVASSLLGAAMDIYTLVIVARVLMTWLPPASRQNPLYPFLCAATDPVLNPIRKILPSTGQLDLSPLVAIVLLRLVRRALFV